MLTDSAKLTLALALPFISLDVAPKLPVKFRSDFPSSFLSLSCFSYRSLQVFLVVPVLPAFRVGP